MKYIFNLGIIILFVFNSQFASAQLERIVVERYYQSDANDATDVTGGGVPEGSVTYRIYVDMLPDAVLKSIYGDALHPFSISSTASFFNHLTDGQSFAKEFIKNRYTENTVALDTWLTLGQTTKKQGEITYFGVLKAQDVDGSFIGGTNNDGGSAAIPTGLLVNNDPSCGAPLTLSDGMDTLDFTISNWFSNGILDFATGDDSTIFGSLVSGTSFYSDNFSLSASGVSGVFPDSNQVLIAQLTTLGDLSFSMNMEIEFEVNGVPTTFYYVGTNEIGNESEYYNPYLNYPYTCGCTDANFVEYGPAFICNEPGACITPVVIGCMDSLACNYDVNVNKQIDELCCYPGWCSNRNIEEVCPQLKGNSFDFSLFPNPAVGSIVLNFISGVKTDLSYIISNSFGVVMAQQIVSEAPLNYSKEIDLSNFSPGIYSVNVITNIGEQHKLFIKL